MLGSHFTAVVVPAPAFRSSRLAAAAALSLLGTALVTALVSSSFAGQHVGSQDTSVSLDTTVCEFFVCVHRNACHRCRWKTRKESSMHTDAIYNPQREECNTEHTQTESFMHSHEHTTTALKERNATYNIHEESYIHAQKKFTCTLKPICSQELRTVNPAVRPSDLTEQFPARAYLGGALDMAHFPPQCPGGGSGVHRCTGLARDCAQCYDGSGHCFPRIHGSGSIQLTKTDGRGSLKSYYYLNIRGTLGHDLVVLLR